MATETLPDHGAAVGGDAGLTALAGTDLWVALAIVGLPLLGAALTFAFGRYKMWRGGALFPIAAIAGSLVASLLFFVRTVSGGPDLGWSTTWFTLHFGTQAVQMPFGILLDDLSVWLATLVSLLSLLITIFATSYLADEPDEKLRRYFAVKSLFVAGMLGTVLLDNYLLLFIFWEVMGLCSYLLIGYWYHKESAAIAAKKAFLVTRLGDILLLMGIILLVSLPGHTLSFRQLFANFQDPAYLAAHRDTLFWAGLLIFGGAVGKSAQWPLDIWLPDAMEGPTTVSALIHAATMVKAGVYLVARTFPLYVALGAGGGLSGETLFILIGAIGGLTALYTATMALAATDIKRVLAFSTLSQLGYMFLALGAGGVLYLQEHDGAGFTAALLHLMNHAFFKALLFLGSASVILGLHHHQDLREMGGLRKRMPITHLTMLVGSLSIAGIIPLSGFWSKDEVLATAYEGGQAQPLFALLWVMGVATALLTAFYMFRMMLLAFYGKPRSEHAEHAHESPSPMTVPLMVLAVAAALSGLWLVTGSGFGSLITYPYSAFLGDAHPHPTAEILKHILTNPLTYLSLAIAAAGILLAVRRYRGGLPASEVDEPSHGWRRLLYKRYYVTEAIYEPLGTYVAYGVARLSAWFDRRGVDGAVNGIARITDDTGSRARRWQDGRLTTYMSSIAVGVVLLLGLAATLYWFNWRGYA
jgi:proton-translocating NADH-quinone oxidoreductase chain L